MSTTIPFSYHLYHIPTQKHYYGVKYSFGSKPEDLWTKYFSSSSVVKKLINEFGIDSFIVEIRKIFNNGNEAILWEHKVLRRLNAASRLDWINRHNGGTKFRAPEHHSEKTKERLKQKITGMKRSTLTKSKLSASALQREQIRRENNWTMPLDAITRALHTRSSRIQQGIINPYSIERNKKMADTKRGCKRQYLPDGSFIMVKPQQDQ